MSTLQILQAIHALSADKQRSLFQRLGVVPRKPMKQKGDARSAPKKDERKPANASFTWGELHQWRKRTFGTRMLTNPVLDEREDSPF